MRLRECPALQGAPLDAYVIAKGAAVEVNGIARVYLWECTALQGRTYGCAWHRMRACVGMHGTAGVHQRGCLGS